MEMAWVLYEAIGLCACPKQKKHGLLNKKNNVARRMRLFCTRYPVCYAGEQNLEDSGCVAAYVA